MEQSLKNPFSMQETATYAEWRTKKLAHYPTDLEALIVPIKNPQQLTKSEYEAIITRCQKTNFVIYQFDADVDKSTLLAFAAQLGLRRLDKNLGADEDGVTALHVATPGQSQEYIPYTDRPLSWHTDGYYNSSDQQVRAILLHCVRPAPQGGENLLLDHELVYLKLRDENPNYIKTFMQTDVMTIPANSQEGIELRAAQTGPVFSTYGDAGHLHMRYTARSRNIVWNDDSNTREALQYLTELLNTPTAFVFKHKLQENQGLLCNNILHNRTGFVDGKTPQHQRLLYRLRFFDRIK